MITATDQAIEKLQQTLFDWCLKEGIGLEKTSRHLLEWRSEKNIEFTIMPKLGKYGNMAMSLRVGRQQQEYYEVIKLGGIKIFIIPDVEDIVRGAESNYCDEPRCRFVLRKRPPAT